MSRIKQWLLQPINVRLGLYAVVLPITYISVGAADPNGITFWPVFIFTMIGSLVFYAAIRYAHSIGKAEGYAQCSEDLNKMEADLNNKLADVFSQKYPN